MRRATGRRLHPFAPSSNCGVLQLTLQDAKRSPCVTPDVTTRQQLRLLRLLVRLPRRQVSEQVDFQSRPSPVSSATPRLSPSASSYSTPSTLSLSLLFALCRLNVKPRLPGRRQDFVLRKKTCPLRSAGVYVVTAWTPPGLLNFEKTCPLRSAGLHVVTA